MRGYFYNLMQLSVFEIAWFRHQHGQLPEDYFTSWVANMAAITKRPTFRTMWRSDRTKILHEGFRQYMEQVMEDTRMPGECYTPTKEPIASTSPASVRRVQR
jgi:hypothetical protein